VFPKVTGDPLYHTEVNTFREKIIGSISQNAGGLISGTAWQIVGGSVLYTGVYPSLISSHFKIDTSLRIIDSMGGVNPSSRIRASGLAFDSTLKTISINTGGLTGPLIENQVFNYLLTSGAINTLGGNIGSRLVFFVEVKTATGEGGPYGTWVQDLCVTGV
jgi:hypothetical protein